MKSFVVGLLLQAGSMMLAQSNPVPFVNQPLVPSAIAPAGPSFTLTVNGTGFVSGSVIKWNGTALSTTFVNGSQLTATVPATDIATPSTASITVSSPSPGGGTSNVLFLAVAAPETSVQFATVKSTTPNGVVPNFQAPIVADFTGNGTLDFVGNVTSGADSYTLFTFLGNNNGTFQLPFQSTTTVEGLAWFATGDFNGDGILDLVGVSNENNTIFGFDIFTGNGNGTFSLFGSGYGFPTPGGEEGYLFPTSGLVTGDFNGDGNLDVALAVSGEPSANPGVYVFLGNGDGTFQSPVISNTGSFLQNIALAGGVGDFNRDGKLDLIGISGTQLAFLQGNGDGTFQAPSTFYPVVAESANGAIIAADLNGDDKLDLITQQPNANTFTVLLGNGDGTFTLQPAVSISGSINPEAALVIGDFYANGKLDLVVSSFLLPGNGNGTFQSPIALPVSTSLTAAGDFNNDGRLDLVVSSPSDTVGPVYLLQDLPVASLNPSSLNFASQLVGTTSAAKAVMLSNVGTGSLKVTSISITGANAGDFSFDSLCGSTPTVAINASCQINVTFTPSGGGEQEATLAISSNGLGSPTSVALIGTAMDFSLTATDPTVSVSPGGTATYTLNIAPVGGFNQPLTLACSGAPTQSTCSVSPNSITLNGSSASTAAVTVTTMGSEIGMTQPFGNPPTSSIFASWLALSGTLGLVMIVGWLPSRSKVRRRLAPYGLAMILLLSIGVTMPSCGGGSNSNSGGGTPAGSYTLTVTGTFTGSSATLSHATKLTLIVK